MMPTAISDDDDKDDDSEDDDIGHDHVYAHNDDSTGNSEGVKADT